MPHGMPLRAAVLDLPLDDQLVGLVEDAALRLLHHQRRHQIFEHRARPGHQRAAGSRSRRSAGRAGTSARSAGRPWRWRTGWSAALPRPAGRSSSRRAGAPRRGSRSTAACAPAAAGRRNPSRRRIAGAPVAQLAAACAQRRRPGRRRYARRRHAPRRSPAAWPPSRPAPRCAVELDLGVRWRAASLRISLASTARLMVRIDGHFRLRS